MNFANAFTQGFSPFGSLSIEKECLLPLRLLKPISAKPPLAPFRFLFLLQTALKVVAAASVPLSEINEYRHGHFLFAPALPAPLWKGAY